MINNLKMKELSIYIHIPFCVRKCLYCDFLSAPAEQKKMKGYVDALCQEMTEESRLYKEYIITTVFIGGGTPSILPGEWIDHILGTVRENFQMEENCEISMETNPGTVTFAKLECWRRAGINRLSIGLQSSQDNELKALGRIHSSEDFFHTYEMIVKCGFDNINIDLMSAIPEQTLDSMQKTLKEVTGLKPPPVHISAYSLMVEEGTPFYDNPPELPEEDTEREMYKITHDILENLGYVQYEISNYAKPGYECRHNQVYWRRGNYLGFGVGAASMVGNVRYSNIRDINAYMDHELYGHGGQRRKSERAGGIKENIQYLSKEEQMEEFMFLGLRMMRGVSEEEFYRTFGNTIDAVYPEIVNNFCAKGLLRRTVDAGTGEHWISLTGYGIDVSNVVMAEFLLS